VGETSQCCRANDEARGSKISVRPTRTMQKRMGARLAPSSLRAHLGGLVPTGGARKTAHGSISGLTLVSED
jgi:hypothetical protein